MNVVGVRQRSSVRIAVRTDGTTGGAVLFSDSPILLSGQFSVRRVEKQSSKIVYFCTVDCENVCGYDVGIGAV